jgi:putative exosortase-associated protein (TIGR04073 family)
MRKAVKVLFVCLIAFAMLSSSASVFAEENNAYTKGKRGLCNVLTGWMEIPVGIHNEAKEDNWLAGVSLGVCKGTVAGIGRTLSGVLELATFPFPTIIGNPTDYEPIVEPEYVWEKWEDGASYSSTVSSPSSSNIK